MMLSQDEAKRQAGRRAIDEFVRDGMKLGLGSGTTSHFFVRELGRHVAAGLSIAATATSRSTIDVATEVGIAITDIDEIGEIDLTIDGPDEIDREFRMIKGGGACLLWEKIVANASRRMITICDESKIVDVLGRFPLPVEVVRFGWRQTRRSIGDALNRHGVSGGAVGLRGGDEPVITDSGNFILDCRCGKIDDPEGLEAALNMIPGVVENGLFTKESDGMVVGTFEGGSYIALKDDGNAGRAAKAVRELAPSGDRHEDVEACCRHFESGLDRMRHDAFRERGIQVGSGVVGGCRRFGLRTERSGTRRAKRGANAMLALKALVMNPRLPDFLEWRANQAVAA